MENGWICFATLNRGTQPNNGETEFAEIGHVIRSTINNPLGYNTYNCCRDLYCCDCLDWHFGEDHRHAAAAAAGSPTVSIIELAATSAAELCYSVRLS